MFAIELPEIERQRVLRPRIVAPQAFASRRESPRLHPLAAGFVRVGDRERPVLAGPLDERRVGLLVVPFVRVRLPFATIVMQSLRLDAARTLRLAGFEFERQRFDQHRVLRVIDRAAELRAGDELRLRSDENRFASRNAEPTLGLRMIAPLIDVHRERQHARRGIVLRDRFKETGLAEFARERFAGRRDDVPFEAVDGAVFVVEQVEFAVGIFGEVDDPDRRVDQFV